MAGLSASDIVRISTSISPQGLVRRETGRGLFLTYDSTISLEERVRTYSGIAGIKEDFEEGSEPYKAGVAWFAQEPMPKNLLVGASKGVFVAEQHPTAIGFSEPDWALADSDGIIGFDVTVTLDDVDTQLSNVYDASGVTNSQELIDLLVVALNADALTNSLDVLFSCTIEGDVAVLVCSAIADSSLVSKLKVTALDTIGIDLIDYLYSPEQGETISTTLDEIKAKDASFTFVMEESAMTDTEVVADIATWCLLEKVYIGASCSNDSSCETSDPSTVFGQISESENGNAFGTYSRFDDKKHVSICARMSSVNFSASNSLITPMFKVLPQTTTDAYTTNVAGKLEDQRINFYSRRSGVAMYETGKTFSPNYWLDTKYWLIWFENAVLSNVFNQFLRSGKIDQTEFGMSVITQAIESVCREGVRNGGIATGTLSTASIADVKAVTGNDSFDGILSDGYLVFSEPVAEQSQNDRNERKGTPVHTWLKGAGAIHGVEVAIKYEQ